MKILKITIVLLLITLVTNAQKEISSSFLSEKIKIDGELNELIWQSNLEEGNFIQTSPNNGKPATNNTKIAITNDESYLYIAAELEISTSNLKQNNINKKLTERDDNGTSDYFGVIIDPFGKSREGWAFLVTAANVQLDIKLTDNDNYSEWNAIWESAVKIHDNKWTVELKIPFNSLRFPKENFDNFTINFERFDAAINENTFWNHIDEDKDGLLNQFGKLKGLKNVTPPINLSFNPFVSFVQENGADGSSNTTFSGGLDLKYVYKNAYTLDISMIPDFSQAPSDDEILNLSPFDIKYNENRQFFVEGTELFDKGNYLYTRRIGGEPIHLNNLNINENEEITKNPITSNILNLIKFTGKSEKGLAIGILNGITKKSEAIIRNNDTNTHRKIVTNPLTNYNAIVLDQTLKNNSSITLINNSVIRNGNDYDANLTAAVVKLYDKNRRYSLSFETALSQKYYSKFSENKDLFGHQYDVNLKKISGKYRGGLLFSLEDDTYDNNDFGFQQRNNRLNYGVYFLYVQTKPKKIFSYYHFLGVAILRDYYSLKESERDSYELEFYGRRNNNHHIYAEVLYEKNRNDFYEARVKDRVFNQPEKVVPFFEYQTNQTKNLSIAGYVKYTKFLNDAIYTHAISAGYGIDYRLGNHLSFEFEQSVYQTPNSVGHLTQIENDIIFGQRKIKQLENGLNIDYAVNSKIHLSTNIRHYWIQVDYKNQFTLLENGSLTTNNYDIDLNQENANFNNFNIDFLAKWQFAPASEISLAYKLSSNYFNQDINSHYNTNFNNALKEKSDTTLALKLTYLIDFNKADFLKKLF